MFSIAIVAIAEQMDNRAEGHSLRGGHVDSKMKCDLEVTRRNLWRHFDPEEVKSGDLKLDHRGNFHRVSVMNDATGWEQLEE